MTSRVQVTAGVPPQQYITHGAQQPGVVQPPPAQTVRYSEASKHSVRGLVITQLILGIVILACQIATTIMNHEANDRVAEIRRNYQIYNILTHGLADIVATGIWVGLGTVLAASFGIAGYKQQSKGLITTHLVFNVFLLLAYIVLMVTLSLTIDTIRYCRSYGDSFYSNLYDSSYYSYSYNYYYNSYYYYYNYRTTTTAPVPILFGEKLKWGSGTFHCSHSFFEDWLAVDVFLLISCISAFFITLVLMIYNSIAVCLCHNCCGTTTQVVPIVTYSTQQPARQFVQPPAVPQLQAAPQHYPQPAPMPVQYGQHPMAPAPGQPQHPMAPSPGQPQHPMAPASGQNMQQPTVMAPPVTTNSAAAGSSAQASEHQPVADNEEGKGEDVPPEYRAVALQSN